MSAAVAFYQLQTKFVNQREDIPETARQVIYYTLAVGHHVGVMDCFTRLVDIPLETFTAWLNTLPEGAGRSKLEGVLRWGEIEINCNHASVLLPLLEGDPTPGAEWKTLLIESLRAMLQEPAYYLMVRKVA